MIIETHSDFLIDRFRLRQAISEKKVQSKVLFFEKSDDGRTPIFSNIEIGEDGHLISPPDSYRSFFVNESIAIFEHL